MTFDEELLNKKKSADAILERYLPEASETPGRLAEAMRYSVLAGGKRVRPILLAESFQMFGGSGAAAEPFMAAIEMIHTSSLVHDDLPAIDNDAYRRGRKTTHAVFGPALGVLAGDALLNLAYETAGLAFSLCESPDLVARALRILAEKTGASGMLGGQSLDVENEKNGTLRVGQETLEYIYLHKTAALIEAPLMIGAVLAGADDAAVSVMEQIGRKTGLAFQFEDDILDVTGSEALLGKPLHSDEANGKTTCVTLFGADRAQKMVEAYTDEAAALLDGLQVPGDRRFLREYLERLALRKR